MHIKYNKQNTSNFDLASSLLIRALLASSTCCICVHLCVYQFKYNSLCGTICPLCFRLITFEYIYIYIYIYVRLKIKDLGRDHQGFRESNTVEKKEHIPILSSTHLWAATKTTAQHPAKMGQKNYQNGQNHEYFRSLVFDESIIFTNNTEHGERNRFVLFYF